MPNLLEEKKLMSNNYEEAWAKLKDIVRNVKGTCSRYEEVAQKRFPDREEMGSAEIAAGIVLDYMDELEEKMITVGEDDDQQAQD